MLARRLDQVKLGQAKAEFQKLELGGIIRRSDSPWASITFSNFFSD